MKEITLDYQMVAKYLLNYYQKSAPLYFTKNSSHLLNFRPDFSALLACTNNLHALSNFKKEVQSNTEFTPSRQELTLWFLCEAISTNCDNTCRVLSTFLRSPIELSNLRLMVNIIVSIPKGDIKYRLCIALADRIIAITQNLNLELIIAIELYKIANEDNNAAIQEKINSCIQTLCQLNRESDYNRILQENPDHLKHMKPTRKLRNTINIYLMRAAIRNNNIEILTYLESNGYLLLIQPVKSSLIAIQLAKSKIVFKYLEQKTTRLLTEKIPTLTDLPIIKLLIKTLQESNHTTFQDSEQNLLLLKARQQYLLEMEKFLSLEQSSNNSDMCIQFLRLAFPVVLDKINELHAKNNVNLTSNTLFNKLNLCLLLSKNPQDKILELLSHLLNKLTGNITRRLLILSHICTYYNSAIKNPEHTKIIFIRALAQLANIEFSEKDSLETLTLKQPKKLLIATLSIYLELVKLLTNEYGELEQKIYQLSNATSVDFLSIYHSCMQTISKVIHEHLTLQDLSISTFYLDSIAQGCMVYLTRPIRDLVEEDYSANESGKRAANKEIPNSRSPKRF